MLILHGLRDSYFTGKVEAYFRAKGVAYQLAEMDMASFRRCAEATGVAQMPQVECPDGTWLTDSTAIMAHFEAAAPEPRLQPDDPAAAFASLLLEDLFDEWLWRPALYYRWTFADDRRLMSGRIARTMFRDVPVPQGLKQRFLLARQRRVYLAQDGVTRATAPAIEALYHDTLALLEIAFARQPFLFGDRPCAADFGLFGPMFRHFSIDPTPAAIMRDEAPRVVAWVGRMWALSPDVLTRTRPAQAIPAALSGFGCMAGRDYLPYLAANATAAARGQSQVAYETNGVSWRIPVAPYRVQCLMDLRRRYQALERDAQAQVATFIGEQGQAVLEGAVEDTAMPSGTKPVGRLWARR